MLDGRVEDGAVNNGADTAVWDVAWWLSFSELDWFCSLISCVISSYIGMSRNPLEESLRSALCQGLLEGWYIGRSFYKGLGDTRVDDLFCSNNRCLFSLFLRAGDLLSSLQEGVLYLWFLGSPTVSMSAEPPFLVPASAEPFVYIVYVTCIAGIRLMLAANLVYNYYTFKIEIKSIGRLLRWTPELFFTRALITNFTVRK